MTDLPERLRGGLIVSVQAGEGSPLDDPTIIAALAAAAQANGAVAVRVEGVADLRAVRARVSLPTIGLIKRRYPGFDPYITATIADVRAVSETGVEIVAFDATGRPRPDGATDADIVAAIAAAGCIAMADCATAADARRASAAGAAILATTLCGYTEQTHGRALPALDMLPELAACGAFTICEGGVARPEQLRAALDAGADAVVVGTAITNVDWLVRSFAGSADTVPNGYPC